MSIGSRIKERREIMHITQEELANLLGVSKGAVGNYESDASYPKIENIYKLMEALKCDANYLFECKEVKDISLSANEKSHIKKHRILDKYGKEAVDNVLDVEYRRCTYVEEKPTITINYSNIAASAGAGAFLDEQNLEPREYPDTSVSRQADIVIPVDGDSMEPVFSDGDELYVRIQPAVNIGEIGIFTVDGKGYVKELAEDRLISLNPKYEDIYPNEYSDTICVGKVLGKVEM